MGYSYDEVSTDKPCAYGVVDEFLPELRDDPRLADFGLAGQEDDLTFAILRLNPAVHQKIDLTFAAKKAGRTLSLPGLEATFGREFANDSPRRNWIGYSLEKPRARYSRSNSLPRNRLVPSAMTTLFGSAIPWRRAARFGVSPMTTCS